MKLKVLGSSSAGNCYLLIADSGETLIIECGIKFDKIKAGLNYNLSQVAGVIMTHEHGDHCKANKDILAAGLKLYTTAGTAEALKIDGHHNCRLIAKQAKYSIGSFKVLAFDIQHDVAEPVGFVINHLESGNILFITDTCYVPYRFPGMNNIIVEANHCTDIIDKKWSEGKMHGFLRSRVLKSHMSINTCRDFLLANDLSSVNNIVLIHLSDNNSNAVEFQEKIKSATGKTVSIAKPGLIIENFNKTPF